MVARAQNFVCQSCGAASARWAGRCDACGAWNTLVEEGAATQARGSRKGRLFVIEPLKGESLEAPRRAVVGWDPSRLSMVLAVLEAHCGVRLSGHDVYLNVAGGLRIAEPAADVAAAAALVSSLAHASLPADAVYFGEVSLSGAVRPVAQTAARLKEAQKLGFGRAIVPDAARTEALQGFALSTIGTLSELVGDIARDGKPPLRRVGGQDGE